MERVKVPARIRREGSKNCGRILKASDVWPPVLVLGSRALGEEALVVGGEVHDTVEGRLIWMDPEGRLFWRDPEGGLIWMED